MMTFPEYESFDGLGLANLVQTGVMSPAELLEAAIERVELRNPQINAVIHKMYDEARASIARGLPFGPFQGVPFLLKDLLADYAGVPTSAGSRFLQNWVPTKDSELVSRFKQAGVVIFGKTNTPEFGLSPTTEPVLFGPTRNPWDTALSVGGSSGGSAAAVASRMVPMAHGNDGAGSIRIPSAYCGLFGMKPSRGRTSIGPTYMQVWQGMVVEHVITRSVRDSAAMLDVLSGPEIGSPISLPKPDVSYLKDLQERPKPLQIAIIEECFFPAIVNREYQQAVQEAAKLCGDLGHQVNTVTLKVNSSDIALAFITVVAGEIGAFINQMSRSMGRKPKHADLELQTAVLHQVGEHFSAADASWGMYILDQAAQQLAHFFQDYDVLLSPTMALPPPKVGGLQPSFIEQSVLEILREVPFTPALRKVVQKAASELLAFTPFTPLFNISGQPAMSVPLYWDSQGLPIGIQFAGRMGDESTLFNLAYQLERVKPWVSRSAIRQV